MRINGNYGQRTQCFTQVRALLMEVKPYSCLIIFEGIGVTRVDLP